MAKVQIGEKRLQEDLIDPQFPGGSATDFNLTWYMPPAEAGEEYRRITLRLLRADRNGETGNTFQILRSIALWGRELEKVGETKIAKRLRLVSEVRLARYEVRDRTLHFRCLVLPVVRMDRKCPILLAAAREEYQKIREVRREAHLCKN